MLKLWTDDNDYAIAETAEEARALTLIAHEKDDYVSPHAPVEEWSPLGDDCPFTYNDDGGLARTKTAAEWCETLGTCYFCTANF